MKLTTLPKINIPARSIKDYKNYQQKYSDNEYLVENMKKEIEKLINEQQEIQKTIADSETRLETLPSLIKFSRKNLSKSDRRYYLSEHNRNSEKNIFYEAAKSMENDLKESKEFKEVSKKIGVILNFKYYGSHDQVDHKEYNTIFLSKIFEMSDTYFSVDDIIKAAN